MSIAKLSSMRSKDPNTQVGACIVASDNRILSIGYNGAPNGYSDDNFPWDREGKPQDTKNLFVCHAELNAILNFRGSKKDLENAKLYASLFPCNECAKMIIQSGITEVIYNSDKYADVDIFKASRAMLTMAGVTLRHYTPRHQMTLSVTDSEHTLPRSRATKKSRTTKKRKTS